MNIQIKLTESDSDLKAIIYNTVKRSQEDFLRRIPTLSDFTVTIKKAPESNIRTGNFPVNAKHFLSEDETELTLQVDYRSAAIPEKIMDALNAELKKMKTFYE